MSTPTASLQASRWVTPAGLVFLLAALLAVSPSEATLGNVVKIVYLHGALERVSTWFFVAAGVMGIGHVAFGRRKPLGAWAQATAETALGLWLAQFLISLPAQVLAWGGISWTEPRVSSAIWIIALTGVIYMVGRWMGDRTWLSLVAVANAVVVILILRGAINILHPFNPILGSDSTEIKIYYAAIVLVVVTLAAWLAGARRRDVITGATR